MGLVVNEADSVPARWFSNSERASEAPRRFVMPQTVRPAPRNSDSLGRGPENVHF